MADASRPRKIEKRWGNISSDICHRYQLVDIDGDLLNLENDWHTNTSEAITI